MGDKNNTKPLTEGTAVKRGLNPQPTYKKPDYTPPAQPKPASSEKKD